MSDLISKSDAIDALFELYEYQRYIDPTEAADRVRQGVYLAEKKIEQLPSVQPDCALKEFGDCSYSETGCSDCKIKNRIRTALNVAQPEIIRCKNCKYWVVEEDEAYCDLVIVVRGAEDGSGFCSEAKRKMDNE